MFIINPCKPNLSDDIDIGRIIKAATTKSINLNQLRQNNETEAIQVAGVFGSFERVRGLLFQHW
jgi:hypothetical protein